MKNLKVCFFALGVGVAFLAGCGKPDPAVVVPQRAAERWNLLISHQPAKAYDYLSPGYRTTHTVDQYIAFIATARLRWKAAKIVGQECDADTCSVNLVVTSTIPAQAAGLPRDIEHEAPVTERWVASEGQWYFLPDSRIERTDSGQEASSSPPASTPAPAAGAPAVPPEQPAADHK